ncbi:hypothetical protein GCM10010207_43770 [Streptomyces atratus]|nr:hypothetical protein GCM10010207_43770 [Streptomyces atratus]
MQLGRDHGGNDGDQRVGDSHRYPVAEQYERPTRRKPHTATTHDEPHKGRDERVKGARLPARWGGH